VVVGPRGIEPRTRGL